MPPADGLVPPGTEVVLRPGRLADARGIAEMHVLSWQRAYRGMMPDDVLDRLSVDEFTRRRRFGLQRDDGALTYVAVLGDDATVVGFVTHGPSRDLDAPVRTGEVWAIYVHPDAAGSGIGRRLLAHAVLQLAHRFEQATLWTMVDNHPARGFYEHEGWTADGATKCDEEWFGAQWELRYRRDLERR